MVEKLRRIVLLFFRDCLSRGAPGYGRVALGWGVLPTEAADSAVVDQEKE